MKSFVQEASNPYLKLCETGFYTGAALLFMISYIIGKKQYRLPYFINVRLGFCFELLDIIRL